MTRRCDWANSDSLLIQYHDEEWGVPQHEDGRLFELLVLGGAQAGLSWLTILRKRAAYRQSFDHFDPRKVVQYGEARIAQLLQDPGIVRNRQKVAAAVHNARAWLTVQEQFGSFDRYLWSFVGNRPRKNAWRTDAEIPAQTSEAAALSQDLKERNFKFVGPTICYAFMQAAGLVNDHLVDCFRYDAVS